MFNSSFIGLEISRIAIAYDLSESILQDYVAKNHAEIDRLGSLLFLYGEEEDLEKMNKIDADIQKSIDTLRSKNIWMNTRRDSFESAKLTTGEFNEP